MAYFEYFGPVAIILICWLCADSMLMKHKIKELNERIKDLEKALNDK